MQLNTFTGVVHINPAHIEEVSFGSRTRKGRLRHAATIQMKSGTVHYLQPEEMTRIASQIPWLAAE